MMASKTGLTYAQVLHYTEYVLSDVMLSLYGLFL
jgi:hypothetical protein